MADINKFIAKGKSSGLYDLDADDFKANAWDVLRADGIANQSVADYIADWYLQEGETENEAIPSIQKIVGAAVTSTMDEETITAINTMEPRYLYDMMTHVRLNNLHIRIEAMLKTHTAHTDVFAFAHNPVAKK